MKFRYKKVEGIKNNFYFPVLIITGLIVLLLIITAAPLNLNIINNEKNDILDGPWICTVNNNQIEDVVLPTTVEASANTQITLTQILPDNAIKGATVLIRTSQQDLVVYVNNEMIYNSKDIDNVACSASSSYHFVRLSSDYVHKEITIVLSSPYADYAGILNQIHIGSKASNLFYIVSQNVLSFILGFLILSIGLILITMFLFIKGRKNKDAIIYLGAFFASAGYWVLVESKLLQFIIPHPMLLTNTSIFAISLLPVFFGLYYYSNHIRIFKKAGKCVILFASLLSFVLGIISIINPFLPVLLLPYYLILLGVFTLFLFAFIILERLKGGRLFSPAVYGMILFAVSALMELILFFIDSRNPHDYNILTMGLFVFSVCVAIDASHHFSQMFQNSIKINSLLLLAYTDSLTGFKNRAAFLDAISKIKLNTNVGITLAMYDINNLKKVNDSMGHLVGDSMILHGAKTIKSALKMKDEVYRIGGDEFVAVMFHNKSLNVQELEEKMQNALRRENKKPLDYNLSVAYGFATYSTKTDKTLFETLARADKNMYKRKRIQKENL